MSGRTPLAGSSVAVFDELQMLLERSGRAEKLEAILMCLRMMPESERPSIIGLSAALSLESTKFLTQWLSIALEDVISSGLPPSVAVQQTGPRRVPFLLPPSSPLKSKTNPVGCLCGWTPSAKKYNRMLICSICKARRLPSFRLHHHGLEARLKERQPLLKGKVPHVPQGELAAILIDSLIESDPDRKVICFVPSRTAAIELSTAVQRRWTDRMGKLERGSPWLVGRFATTQLSDDEAARRFNSLKHSDIPNADSVIRGLLHGVAAHSASFTASLRRLLEDEFRRVDGLLRVLIATDTLAVGVNLPADTVIATSISGFSGTPRSRRLLDPSNLDNKAGRAGRLGRTARNRGEFYLLVPSQSELQGVSDIGARQLEELSTVEGVFESSYRNFQPRRSGQKQLQDCRANGHACANCALSRWLCSGVRSRGPERVREILDSSLLAVEDPQPSADNR